MESQQETKREVVNDFDINVQVVKVTTEKGESYEIDYSVAKGEELALPASINMHDGYAIQLLLHKENPARVCVHLRTCRWICI